MLVFVVLALQVLLFALVAVLLHYLSPRFGLTLLLFYIAAAIAILNFAELMALFIEPYPDIVIRTGGHVLVPIIMSILLILYVADGTPAAQLVMTSLTGVNLLVLTTLLFLVIYQSVPLPETGVAEGLLMDVGLINVDFAWGVVASMIAFIFDLYIIAIVYQGMNNVLPRSPQALRIVIALILALWVDSILYLQIYGLVTNQFIELLPGDILAKTFAGLVCCVPVTIYLTRIAPLSPSYVGVEGRPVFDMLFGTWDHIRDVIQTLQDDLAQTQAVYEHLAENLGNVFWVADAQTQQLLYVSPAFEEVIGYDSQKFLDDPDSLLTCVDASDRDLFAAGILATLKSYTELEFRIRCREGELVWLRSRSFLIDDLEGDVQRYGGLLEDVTERKALHEQELMLAFERERVEALNTFISEAAHDLKTPLSSIRLKLDLVQRMEDGTRRERLIEEMRERTKHLTQLLEEVFTLSRIESQTTSYGNILLVDLVERAIGLIKPLASEKGLSMQFETGDEAKNVLVRGNDEQLMRVLLNLLSNAVRYTAVGAVTIKVERVVLAQVAIRIRDTGIGIAPEDVERIFERFYRARTATTHKIRGTGLGLAICRRIIEQHGGTILVESVVGEGSTFTVQLPLLETSAMATEED